METDTKIEEKTDTPVEKLQEVKENSIRLKPHIQKNKNIGKNYKELKRALNNVSEGVLVTDKNDTITFANKKSTKIFNKTKGVLVNSNLLRDLNDVNFKSIKSFYIESKKSLSDNSIKSLGIKNKNNNERTISCEFIPLKKRMHFNGMLCIFDDITYYNKCNRQKKIANNYLDIAEVIIVILNKKGRVTLINKKGRKLLGYKRNEIIGKNWFDNFIPLKESKELKYNFRKYLKDQYSFPTSYENSVLTKSGTERVISWNSTCIRDADDNIISIISSGEDVTEKKNMERKLVEDEKRFRMLTENANDVIFRYRLKPERKCEYISPSVERLTGYTPEENYDDPDMIFKMTYGADRPLLNKIIDSKKRFRKPVEIRWNNKNNGIIWTEHNIAPIYSNNEIVALDVIARDITERKKAEKKIRYLSFHDSLTGLFNRAYFEEEIKRLNTPRQLPLSFIMGDVNSLKLVNDTFGHKEGDELLKSVAGLMKKFCRKEDLIARWGGDEFAILLPQTQKNYSEEIIERIREACRKTSRRKIPISISLGLAIKTSEEQDINSIASEAEDNMYKSKLLEKKGLSASIISSLTNALFEKDTGMEKHITRTREMALEVGRSLKLEKNRLDNLSLLTTLHDIGKIAIPDELLNKRTELTKREWEIIKRHSEIGYNICKSFRHLAHIANAVLTHHENYDGTGYPQGLKGNEIPIESRIIAIVDTYDVMTKNYTYRQAINKKDAIKKIKELAGTQFDPVIVKKFVRILNKN